ncbi:hypothetical protein, partial [Campylobacter concisus]|uniref:hypothetical protein n=1 Tax=Campylobacter concisus TaxID=199 RepID=UPI001CA30A29
MSVTEGQPNKNRIKSAIIFKNQKKSPPSGGERFLGLKKAGCFQPVFFDFGKAEIGSFLILI